jgi:hypothetical protein
MNTATNTVVWATVVTAIAAIYWNPLDYFAEAGASAYYQARIAYERGHASEKDAVTRAFDDGNITMHDYSELVFPAYLRVSHDGEAVFPDTERTKTVHQLRAELASATGLSPALR